MLNKYFYIWTLFVIEKVIFKLHFPERIIKIFDLLVYKLVYIQIKKYLELAKENIDFSYSEDKNRVAWVFWWQGIENSPEIVKACVNSIKSNLGYKVIVLDKDNLSDYTNIPNYIYKKLINGNMSKTHFSDILRFNLLREHGGLWIDATILCVNPVEDILINNFYTSSGKKDAYPYFIEGKWTGFLIGGVSNDPMFQFMDNFFKLYWKENNYLINYFLIDHVIKYAYDWNIGSFKSYVDNYAFKNNRKLFELQVLLNNKFNGNEFKYLSKNTSMFKLTYKKRISNHIDSYYSYIIDKWT